MSERPPIEPGKTYWVRYAGQKFKVEAVRPARAVPGWWFCVSRPSREQAIFPEKAFGAEVKAGEYRRILGG